ncbi:hypothetical protein D187_002856 [Cystobacter fuscus DSM 2262]|uniref:Uncharacterized protein n=1 Tax=Cystobacter fuscus (strain ATCC 25194 / DSM 2262 / NBRC 100088 / M29) TaxID=1242864 RepID=S9P887_CYSF2|nr:hypothetical protein D187_002856 [Cystobacter fuscus DSM 2262]
MRVTVKYGSYRPACLRVVARDSQGHVEQTDILQDQFKDPEARQVLVAVFRKAEWERQLSLEVSSFDGSTDAECSGTLIETYSTPEPIQVPLGDIRPFEAVLRAKDEDGDTFIAREEGVAGTDCNDGDNEVHPGAAERCSASVDSDCNGLSGCQDSRCQQASCDDGNACTTQDVCTGASVCQGIKDSCAPSSICFRVTGGDCAALGNCTEAPDPSKVNAACTLGGQSGVCRAADGKCSRFPYIPSNFDPDAIPTESILPLTTKCNVTFDSTTLSWSDGNCVSNPPTPIELPQGNGMVLFALSKLELSAELRLVGNRPVIFAVYGDATLNSYILANAQGTVPGAGGSLESACEDRRGKGGLFSSDLVGGGGGGAGGGTVGGAGGNGTGSGATRGDGGLAGGNVFVPLVGGCSGGSGGGGGGTEAQGGAGGAGGGAVQVSVSGTLTVTKQVSASAGGGRGGQFSSSSGGQAGGGGGGGSGGQVLLEAYHLKLESGSRLTANGGGGGEGGGYHSSSQRNGRAGADGSVDSGSQAVGGSGDSQAGGDGGNGGAQSKAAAGTAGSEVGVGAKGGGGGGGGAAGHIRLRSVNRCTLNSPLISPATDTQCPL